RPVDPESSCSGGGGSPAANAQCAIEAREAVANRCFAGTQRISDLEVAEAEHKVREQLGLVCRKTEMSGGQDDVNRDLARAARPTETAPKGEALPAHG